MKLSSGREYGKSVMRSFEKPKGLNPKGEPESFVVVFFPNNKEGDGGVPV